MRTDPVVTPFLLLLASLVTSGTAAAQWRGAIEPITIRKTVLDNGLTLLTVPFDSPGLVAYHTVVRVGSRNEVEEGLSGFAHFFEHMMFRGTERFSAGAYNDFLKSLGVDANAFTDVDQTCYHMTVPSSALAQVVDIESDRFRNLKYDEASFEKEARAVLGEYNQGASSPLQRLDEVMQSTAYTRHSYRHTTIGFLEDVKAMPTRFAYSRTFFDRWYRPENCTIIAAGDVVHDDLARLVRDAYGGWARGAPPAVSIPEEPPQTSRRSVPLVWPSPTSAGFYLGYHIPASDPSNPDTAALCVLAEAVFGPTSPLYKSLVIDERKVLTLDAAAAPRRDPGLFTVVARLRSRGDLDDVRSRIESALIQAGKEPIHEERLLAIKAHMRYAFAARLESAEGVALVVGQSVATTGNPEAWAARLAGFALVSTDDLQRVATRYFLSSNETAVTLEPEPPK